MLRSALGTRGSAAGVGVGGEDGLARMRCSGQPRTRCVRHAAHASMHMRHAACGLRTRAALHA